MTYNKLYLFNPDSEMAIAAETTHYMPPAPIAKMIVDLACIPICFADDKDIIITDSTPDKVYLEQMNRIFGSIPSFFHHQYIETVSVAHYEPWGWNPIISRLFHQPWDSAQKLFLSRITAQQFLSEFCRIYPEYHSYVVPVICRSIEEIQSVAQQYDCVVKAPWSSSGRGNVYIAPNAMTKHNTAWITGILRRQQFVTVERMLNKVMDFAAEFHAENGKISFIGYSLFQTSTEGAYTGNLLGKQSELKKNICQYISESLLDTTIDRITSLLNERIAPLYKGYFGLDMMIYHDLSGNIQIQPCIEINFRYNMGIVALALSRRVLADNCTGTFSIDAYRNEGEALAKHLKLIKENPLHLTSDGKINSGYINITPISQQTQFVARITVP